MTRVLCTSSFTGAALLAAAVDSGLLGSGRRVLVVANEADTPEAVPGPSVAPGFGELADRFDEVVSWNALIAPLHPSAWRPPQRELPVLGRLLTARLSGGGARDETIDEVVVESITEGPGRTLVALLPEPAITIATPTLDAYAPAFGDAATEPSERIARLLHLDLLPTVAARLRVRDGVDVQSVPLAAMRAELPTGRHVTADAVLLGDRWAELGLVTAEEEVRARTTTLGALADGGYRDVVFAPDPAALPVDPQPLLDAAAQAGVRLTLGRAGDPHEQWAGGDALVVGTTAPATALAARGAVSGTRAVLDALGRFDHPLRMPLVLADAGLSHLEPDGRLTPSADVSDLAHLADAVSYCLLPDAVPQLRTSAVHYVARHGAAPYLHRGRLAELSIPIPSAPRAERGQDPEPRSDDHPEVVGRPTRWPSATRARSWLNR